VERAFCGYCPGMARRLVGQIRHRRRHLIGDWYLGVIDGRVVGGIGLFLFETGAGRIGRLQDVDIAPAFQGQGLGRELLWGACEEAKKLGLDAVCLRADPKDWPKVWYIRSGFLPVGTWTSFTI
jgi:predicted N-acetyltransferase YhbS